MLIRSFVIDKDKIITPKQAYDKGAITLKRSNKCIVITEDVDGCLDISSSCGLDGTHWLLSKANETVTTRRKKRK